MTVPSYSAPGYPTPAPRSRPTTVTVAGYLLFLVAAIQLINAIAVFSTAGAIGDAVKDVYAGTEAAGAEGFVSGIFIAGGVINLLIGAGFAILAIFNNRGKNPSRIVTWVVGGIALCCLGAGLGSNALVSGMNTGSGTGGPSQDQVESRITGAMPGWYEPTTTTLTVVALLAILGTVILLALPASNEFFRKPAAAAWDPNTPQYPGGGPYTGQQPPYPGQQYAPSPYPTQGNQYPGQQQHQAPPQYPAQQYPGQQSYPGQQPYPGQPGQPGQQGQPGQSAPGLPPYPGQQPPSDPTAGPPSQSHPDGEQPPRDAL